MPTGCRGNRDIRESRRKAQRLGAGTGLRVRMRAVALSATLLLGQRGGRS